MRVLRERKSIFVVLFVCMLAVAGFGQYTANAGASSADDSNATIPPPGGTLPPNSSGIQLLNLAPFNANPNVDVVISGTNVSIQYNNLGLGQSTGAYQAVAAGAVGGSVTPLVGGYPPFALSETLAPNVEYTTAFIGGANLWPLEFLTLVDTTPDPQPLYGKVRVVHAAPFAPPPAINTAVNVVNQGGATIDSLFEGLLYQESTPYLELPVGFYDWKAILPSGTDVIDLPGFQLYSEAVVTIYLVGDGNPGTVQQPAGLFSIQRLGQESTVLYLPVNPHPY